MIASSSRSSTPKKSPLAASCCPTPPRGRLNREGRSANLPWYQEFKKVDPGDVSWDDVIKMNPSDGEKLGLKTGDTVLFGKWAGSDVKVGGEDYKIMRETELLAKVEG